MAKVYLLINAALYLLLAILCTVRHRQTAKGTGYLQLDAGGHSEYLVIYGGLQLGLALIFAFLAREESLHRVGLLLGVLLYAPIVAYRVITIAIYRPTNAVTLGTAALELVLLVWGFFAWRNSATI